MPFWSLLGLFTVFCATGCADADTAAINVIAATSLKQAMEPIVAAYNDQHSDVEVKTSFAPSDQIQRQIEGGYHADLVVTASGDHMRPLVDAELAIDAEPFASNTMVVAVGNHAKDELRSLRDLAGDVRVSMGDSTVPVGKYSQLTIDALDRRFGDGYAIAVARNVVNRAGSAADVITPVALGGVDASISYATDARANADRVSVLEIPGWAQPEITYWAAASPDASTATRAFIDFIQSPNGQQTLEAEGFVSVDAAAGEKP